MSIISSGSASIAVHSSQQSGNPSQRADHAVNLGSQSQVLQSGQPAAVTSLVVDSKRATSRGEQKSVDSSFERQGIKKDKERENAQNDVRGTGKHVSVTA